MQHGASPYGAPPPEPAPLHGAEAASPISARPPLEAPAAGFEDPGPSAAHGSFPDEDFGERGAATGNRWPRQETLALLQIRSDMDAAFRDATLKGPLWEDVSRKLGELGYRRSGKKCKEKFENVLKYYKRTKEGRGGRQDGKSYRFFDQLQALHPPAAAAVSASIPVPTPNPPPAPVGFVSMEGAAGSAKSGPIPAAAPPPVAASAGISFSSDTSSLPESETEGEEEGGLQGRKRKHSGDGGGGAGRKMMAFFDGLMRRVLERQDAMQQRFLEAIERREQDRMVREEGWRRQEMARLAREHEILAQERAAAASRDAAIIAFLQKITGQTIQIPQPPAASILTPPPPPPHQPSQPQPQQNQREQQQQRQLVPPTQPQRQQSTPEVVRHHQPPTSTALVPVPAPQDVARGASLEPASSRWPKAEVHALINLRSSLEAKYQEAGPKGPLWEEISAEMGRLGHNRSAKRCKEKWENINKYFKKVKESSKKRPEDAKTCPYFHQLDALYRRKLSNTGVSGSIVTQRQQPQGTSPNPQETGQPLAIMAPPPPVHQPNDNHGNGGGAAVAAGPTNGGATMKPEDIVKEQEEPDIYGADGDYDDDGDDDEASKMQYRVQFQKPNTSGGGGPAPSTAGPFLALYGSSGNP